MYFLANKQSGSSNVSQPGGPGGAGKSKVSRPETSEPAGNPKVSRPETSEPAGNPITLAAQGNLKVSADSALSTGCASRPCFFSLGNIPDLMKGKVRSMGRFVVPSFYLDLKLLPKELFIIVATGDLLKQNEKGEQVQTGPISAEGTDKHMIFGHYDHNTKTFSTTPINLVEMQDQKWNFAQFLDRSPATFGQQTNIGEKSFSSITDFHNYLVKELKSIHKDELIEGALPEGKAFVIQFDTLGSSFCYRNVVENNFYDTLIPAMERQVIIEVNNTDAKFTGIVNASDKVHLHLSYDENKVGNERRVFAPQFNEGNNHIKKNEKNKVMYGEIKQEGPISNRLTDLTTGGHLMSNPFDLSSIGKIDTLNGKFNKDLPFSVKGGLLYSAVVSVGEADVTCCGEDHAVEVS